MASGQVLSKLRTAYAKAAAEAKKWNAGQERVASLLGTVENILQRLPALQDVRNYGSLSALDGYKDKLVAKQVLAVENLFRDIQTSLGDMHRAVEALERIHTNAKRTVQQDKRLTASVRQASSGPVPSIDDCLEGLQSIWQMHAEEQKLQQVLVAQVHYDRTAEEVAEILTAVVVKPNIDSQRLYDLIYVMEATADIKM